jgi:HlyD family secretion protein
MKHLTFPMIFMLLAAACHPGDDLYDATGAFEAVETIVPAQATGILTDYAVQEGQRLAPGTLVGPTMPRSWRPCRCS